MNKVKYILITLILLAGFLLPGELYQLYVNQFNDFYETSFYLQGSATKEQMLEDIAQTAQQHELQVFTMQSEVIDTFRKEIVIYCNAETEAYLKKHYDLREGHTDSIFCGSTSVAFRDFKASPDSLILAKKPAYYLIGDPYNMEQMKIALIDRYGGSFPKQNDFSQYQTVRDMVIGAWCLLMLLLCFVGYYTVNSQQREWVVRASMGEPLYQIYWKTVSLDTVWICLVSIIIIAIMDRVSHPTFMMQYTLSILAAGILLNNLLTLRIFGFKIRSAFQNAAGYKEILLSNYVVKSVTCAFTVLLLTVGLSNVLEAFRFYKQEEFFQSVSEYSYCDIMGEKGNQENYELINEQFYRLYGDQMIILDPLLGTACYPEVIVMTNDMLPWLETWVDSFQSECLIGTLCLLLPESCARSEEEEEILFSMAAAMLPEDMDVTCQVLTYPKAETIAVASDLENYSAWVEDPCILLLNTDIDFAPLDQEAVMENTASPTLMLPRLYNCLTNVPKEELLSFAETYGCQISVTNGYQYYLHRKNIMRRTLYLNSILAVMVLLLEMMINVIIVRMEYQINAIELALKRTLGYTQKEQLWRMYIVTAITLLFSTAVSVLILHLYGRTMLGALLCAPVIVGTVELFTIRILFEKFERNNFSIILKGGRI